jgi:hypothetical protein
MEYSPDYILLEDSRITSPKPMLCEALMVIGVERGIYKDSFLLTPLRAHSQQKCTFTGKRSRELPIPMRGVPNGDQVQVTGKVGSISFEGVDESG